MNNLLNMCALALSISLPAQITSVSPDSWQVGHSVQVTLSGTGFTGTSVLNLAGFSHPFVVVSDAKITFQSPTRVKYSTIGVHELYLIKGGRPSNRPSYTVLETSPARLHKVASPNRPGTRCNFWISGEAGKSYLLIASLGTNDTFLTGPIYIIGRGTLSATTGQIEDRFLIPYGCPSLTFYTQAVTFDSSGIRGITNVIATTIQ